MREAALRLLARQGYAATTLAQVAVEAGVALEAVYRTLGRREDLILLVYQRLATDLEARVGELPAGSVSRRFDALLRFKGEAAAPYRHALREVLARLEDPADPLGVLARDHEALRRRVTGIVAAAVYGATPPPPPALAPQLTRSLYRLHLAQMWLWARDPSPAGVLGRTARELTRLGLRATAPGWPTRLGSALVRSADRLFPGVQTPLPGEAPPALPIKILERIFARRRLHADAGPCADGPCPICFALHLPLVDHVVARGEPLELILPAFPAKSPNRTKTLGALPDLAEELALITLNDLCREIAALHPPGARLVICSDGRAFSDLVGVDDDDVSAYGEVIATSIERLGLEHLSVFRLEDVFPERDFDRARAHLDAHYAEPLEVVRRRAAEHRQHGQLLNGIHRFLFEDGVALEPGKSRTRVRKETRPRALRVVQRSNAWTRLIRECFPAALRLSIHPQDPHSEKIGVLLTRATDAWITPWHGVVVLEEDGYLLTKRSAAEAQGARLAVRDGRPSHFVAAGVVEGVSAG